MAEDGAAAASGAVALEVVAEAEEDLVDSAAGVLVAAALAAGGNVWQRPGVQSDSSSRALFLRHSTYGNKTERSG